MPSNDDRSVRTNMRIRGSRRSDKQVRGSGCTKKDFQEGMQVRIVKGQNAGKTGFVTKVNAKKLTVKENLSDIAWMSPLFDYAEPLRRGMPKGMRAVIEREERLELMEAASAEATVVSDDINDRVPATAPSDGGAKAKLWNEIDVITDLLAERMRGLSVDEKKAVVGQLESRTTSIDT